MLEFADGILGFSSFFENNPLTLGPPWDFIPQTVFCFSIFFNDSLTLGVF